MEKEFQPNWPQGFDFYEFGSIAPSAIQFQTRPDRLIEDRLGIGVRLYDFDANKNRLMVFLVKPDSDLGMYLEIANILAARMADQEELLIGAPSMIAPKPLQATLEHAKRYSVYEYTHRHLNKESNVIAILIDGPATEPGNA